MSQDVIVVGCGVAGMAAAVSAAETGLRVTVLERSSEEERGGNSRYTSAWMRMSNEDEISDDLIDLLVERGQGAIPPDFPKEATRDYADWPPQLKAYPFTDPELISALAENAPPTMHWLKSHGIKFITYEPMLLETGAVRMGPSGGGLAVIDSLGKSAERLGVNILYNTTARSLLQTASGEVGGVRCWSKSRGLFDLESKAVVIASGGFQGNVEMMTRYAGANAVFARPVSAGGLNNKGEGLEMMLAMGAAPAGQYDMFHGAPIDPRSSRAEAIVGVVNFGILVNSQGKRFVDEGTNTYEHFYDEVAWTIMRQKLGIAYLIFDGTLFDIPNVRSRIQTEMGPARAHSLEELATALSLPVDTLTKTVREYNAATRPGTFNVRKRDGLSTQGLALPKSNWARPINEQDLQAYPIMCGNTFTCGGVKITADAEVVNRDGTPIPGLFAAGETTGLYYTLYVGATSVLRGLVFGRQAGRKIGVLLSPQKQRSVEV
jgi:tricarballylate dehydrogenase